MEFWEGPTNAIDRLIEYGSNAIEISWRTQTPLYLIQDRFAHKASQLVEANLERLDTPA